MESFVNTLMNFENYSLRPQEFFRILPKEWCEEIAPIWCKYASDAEIFCLTEKEKPLAGGIVFYKPSPDTIPYKSIAEQWFQEGYLYIGFLYVKAGLRKRGLGSLWFDKLKSLNPDQRYWLSIEDLRLVDFYVPLGFQVEEIMEVEGKEEWILVEAS